MRTPLILTFDVGTQSTRCLLVRPDGSFADLYQVKYAQPYRSRNPGWAEQEPDFYYDQICEAGRAVCQRSKGLLGEIAAVAVTAIRDTVLCLDGDNRPLRDIILWLDKRQADFDNPFPTHKKLMFKVAGMDGPQRISIRPPPATGSGSTSPRSGRKRQNTSCCPPI